MLPAPVQVDCALDQAVSSPESAAIAPRNDAPSLSTGVEKTKAVLPLNARKDTINALVGVRIFPAFCVVFHHAESYFSCWRGVADGFDLSQATSFFFVLSGFLLTHRYEHLHDQRSVFKFYISRLAKVWPLHVLSVILLIALVPDVFRLTKEQLPVLFSNLLMVQAWVPSWHYFYSYNAPSWNNSALLFIYLCFPLLLWGIRRNCYAVLAVGVSLVVAMVTLCNVLHVAEFHPTGLSMLGLVYVNPLARMLEFILGMVGAVMFGKFIARRNVSVGMATFFEIATITSILFLSAHASAIRAAVEPLISSAGAFWLQNCGIPVLGITLLIATLATERGLLAQFLRTPTLVMLGKLSFAAYLLHSVFLAFRAVNFPQEDSTGACLLFVSSLLLASHLVHKLVEKPLQRWIVTKGNERLGSARARSEQKTSGHKQAGFKAVATTVAQLGLLVVLLYASIPTIHCISRERAKELSVHTATAEVIFGPYLACHVITARSNISKVSLSMVWESLRSQKLDSSIDAQVIDADGRVLGRTTFVQDPRRTSVDSGMFWSENIDIPVCRPVSGNSKVVLTVVKAKRHPLLPQISGAKNASAPGCNAYKIWVPVEFSVQPSELGSKRS